MSSPLKPFEWPATQEEFFWWQGASGQWYIHTVFPFTRELPFAEANYGLVRRELLGRRTPFYFGQSKEFGNRLADHEKFEEAARLGANEIHVHFLATDSAARVATETDLRHGHYTPLNRQPIPTPGSEGLLGGLARLHRQQDGLAFGLLGRLAGETSAMAPQEGCLSS